MEAVQLPLATAAVVEAQPQLAVLALAATLSQLRHSVLVVVGDSFAGEEEKLHHGTNDCGITSVCEPKQLMIGMA